MRLRHLGSGARREKNKKTKGQLFPGISDFSSDSEGDLGSPIAHGSRTLQVQAPISRCIGRLYICRVGGTVGKCVDLGR